MDSLKRLVKDPVKKISSLFNFTIPVRHNGQRYKIPVVNNIGLPNFANDKDWFFGMVSCLKLPAGSTIIDVGANVGQSMLALRSRFNNPYYGFEPSPHCVFYLNKLIRLNRIPNVHILPIGLSSSSQIIKFYSKDAAEQAATMIEDLRPGHYNQNDVSYIPVFSFDELNLSGIQDISFIKIDVEGAELEVLTGFSQTIRKFNPLIICEVLDCHDASTNLEKHQGRADQLVNLMKELEYRIFRINLSGKLGFEEIQAITLKQYTPQSHLFNDYLFLPKNRSLQEFFDQQN